MTICPSEFSNFCNPQGNTNAMTDVCGCGDTALAQPSLFCLDSTNQGKICKKENNAFVCGNCADGECPSAAPLCKCQNE